MFDTLIISIHQGRQAVGSRGQILKSLRAAVLNLATTRSLFDFSFSHKKKVLLKKY